MEDRVAALERELEAVRCELRSVKAERRRGPIAAAAAAGLALLVTPLAAGAAGDDDPASAEVSAKRRAVAVQVQRRNRSRGETGLIANAEGYSLRLSNVKRGRGGGAIFGCRAAAGRESCVNADNLADGRAFFFRSRKGSSAGHFQVDGPNAVPFTTNARGMVENLNAEMVGGFTAQELLSRVASDPVQGPPGPKGDPGAPGVSGLQRVEAVTTVNSDAYKSVSAVCPDGKKVLGGGATLHLANPSQPVALEGSQPSIVGSDDAWLAWAREKETTTGNWWLRSYAICANVGP